jgi:hypothetical protein
MGVFKQFLAETLEWTHEMTGREAMDAGHINRSMFKALAKHKTHYLTAPHFNGGKLPTYSFEISPYATKHVHITHGEHHIDLHMSKRGKIYRHHAYKVTDDPNGIMGKHYQTISKSALDKDD